MTDSHEPTDTSGAGPIEHDPTTSGPLAANAIDAGPIDADAIDLDSIEADLDDVQAALVRLADGSYWTDEVTGDPIPAEILAADPLARRAR